MIQTGVNSPLSSGAGRLFDAVSALIGLCPVSLFDSEAPMRLESAINTETDLYYPFTLAKSVIFAETFKSILDDMNHSDISLISSKFHNTLVQVILEVSEKIRKDVSINKVVLSGGVFQNKYLLEKTIHKLTQKGFKVFTNHQVPANDGGISLGQLVVASNTFKLCV
jgi:hydrogenase maturation protein HypF